MAAASFDWSDLGSKVAKLCVDSDPIPTHPCETYKTTKPNLQMSDHKSKQDRLKYNLIKNSMTQ